MGKGFNPTSATVGVEFLEYTVQNIDNNVDISLQLWDTCKFNNFLFKIKKTNYNNYALII